jgi:hypothetical protein
MSSLSAPLPRRLIHTRDVRTRGFLRDDGLWDIEGELRDEKTYTYNDRERGPLPAGSPMHLMRARLTVDHELTVHAAEVDMDTIPFSTCAGAASPAFELIGKSLQRGFGRAIGESMGGTSGCTHVRYLILALANTAYQTISAYREQFMPELGAPKTANGERPFYLDQCRSWDVKGPVVARFLPQFHEKA